MVGTPNRVMAASAVSIPSATPIRPSSDVGASRGATTTEWMGWTISRRTSRETGIPAGLPYLTGFVIQEGIVAEAARD